MAESKSSLSLSVGFESVDRERAAQLHSDKVDFAFAVADCCLNSRYVTTPSPQDMGRQQAKSLGKLNIDEVCHWFTGIGLHKCLPFIRGIEFSLAPPVSFPRFDEDSDSY